MELRELRIDLSVEEYEMLHHPIYGNSHHKTLLRRLQPYINHELRARKITTGIRLIIKDRDLIEFCVKYRVYGMKGGFKRGFEALRRMETERPKRSTDEKSSGTIGNANVGRKASTGNIHPV